MNFCIIGGDIRNFYLAKILSKEKNNVKLYGFDKIENFRELENYSEMIKWADCVILPIPFTKDNKYVNMPYSNRNIGINELFYYLNNKEVFAGVMSKTVQNELTKRNNIIIDFMQKEEFAILNAIPTAEATIEIILKNMKTVLQNSNCLIMGFGRIGKILAYKLKMLSARVVCIPMSDVEKAWGIAYGFETEQIRNLQQNAINLKKYDIIVNTIPKIILKKELKEIRKETLLIDLASKPYGFDRAIVKEEELNFVEALSLPRKICPYNICSIYGKNYKML